MARRQVATARRLLLKPLQSATFTYSAIFAGATLIDGKMKRDRRKELDEAIEEAKLRLIGEATGPGVEEVVPVRAALEQPSVLERRATIDGGKAHMETMDPQVDAIQEWDEIMKNEMEGKAPPPIPRTMGARIERHRLPPQSLWATSEARQMTAESIWTDRKLQMNGLAVGRLILDILITAGLYKDGPRPPDQYPSNLDELRQLDRSELVELREQLGSVINTLRWVEEESWDLSYSEFVPFLRQNPWIPQFADAADNFKWKRLERNWRMFNTLQTSLEQNSGFGQVAVRLCELLALNVAPDHVTYNVLLLGLSKRRHYDLVDRVCDLMEIAKIRPNELTCALVLEHYTRTNNVNGFSNFVDKMRGLRAGLMLARPDLAITSDNAARLILKHDAKKRKIIQKVTPTPMVYSAFVSGLIKFLGIDATVTYCEDLKSDGWGVDKRVLGQFMQEYARRSNWDSCLAVWREYQKLAVVTELEDLDYSISATMLTLCQRTERFQEFEKLYSGALSRGFDRRWLQKTLHRRRQKESFVPNSVDWDFETAFSNMTNKSKGSQEAFMVTSSLEELPRGNVDDALREHASDEADVTTSSYLPDDEHGFGDWSSNPYAVTRKSMQKRPARPQATSSERPAATLEQRHLRSRLTTEVGPTAA